MKKPMTVRATGLGHPEGPYELDDGRVIFANTYASEIGFWDPKTNKQGQFAFVGGGPNACMLGSDGAVYSTQTPTVGAWVAPVHRPPSIQKTEQGRQGRNPGHRSGRQEVRRSERPHLRPRRPALLHRFRRLEPGRKAASRPHRRHREERHRQESSKSSTTSIRTASSRNPTARSSGSNPTRCASCAARPTARRRSFTPCPTAIFRTVSRSTRNGDFWITTVASGGVDHIRKDGTPVDFLEVGGTILNCAFGKGGKLFCCDMGPFDTSGAAMTGRLVEVDLGVEGMPLFRGAIG